jgi:hypothetical protein
MRFLILDSTGHTTMEFSNDDPGIQEAMARFKALVEEEKNVAAVKTGDTSARVIKSFGDIKPDDDVLFRRQLVGG